MHLTRKYDYYLALVLFLASLGVLHNLLTADYEYPIFGGEKNKVARIQNVLNAVRTKSIDHAAWLEARNDSTIYNNDKIFTDENSKVTVAFNSGNELVVNSESLIQISFTNNTYNLDVERGSFIANFSSDNETFLLLLGGREYRLKSKKGAIKINNKTLSVLSGAATIEVGNEVVELKDGEITNLAEPVMVIKSDFPRDLSIADEKSIYWDELVLMPVTWDYESDLKFELSEDEAFTKILRSQIGNKKIDLSLTSLKEGIYFIRFLDEKSQRVSSAKKFYLKYERPPSLQIEKKTWIAGETFFVDISHPDLTDFELFVTSAENKKEKILVLGNSASFKIPLEISKFKVSAVGKKEDRPYVKESQSIEVQVLPRPTLGPQIISPRSEEEFFFYGPAKIEILLDKKYDLVSGVYVNGQRYIEVNGKIEIDSLFSETLQIKSFYELEGEEIYSSQINVFSFVDTKDLEKGEGKKFILKKPGQDVRFDWNKSEDAGDTTYLLEVSRSATFKNISKKIKTNDANANIKFQEVGELFWRVKKINTEGRIEFSNPQRLILLKPPPPLSPKLRKIIKKRVTSSSILNLILDFLMNSAHAQELSMEDEHISWDAIDGVEKYNIEIYTKIKNKQIINEIISRNSYSIKSLKPGNYRYRVASIDYWGQVGNFSELFDLEISTISNPVLLVSPKHQEKLVKNEVKEFRWQISSELNTKGTKLDHHLEFSNDLDFKNPLQFKTTNTSLKVDISKLDGVKLYWRVVTKNKNKTVSKSKRRLLEISTPVVAEKVQNTFTRKFQDTWSFSYRPNSVSLEKDIDSNRIEIEGVDLISFGVNYHHDLKVIKNFSSFLDISFLKSSGKVFDEQDYSSNFLAAKYLLRMDSFAFGACLYFLNGESYSVSDSKVASANYTKVFLGPDLNFNLERLSLEFKLSLYLVGASGFAVESFYEFSRPRFLIKKIGFFFSARDLDTIGKTVSLGPIFLF